MIIKAPKSTALTGYKRDIDDYNSKPNNQSSNKTHIPDEQMGARILKRIKTGKNQKGEHVHTLTKQTELKSNVNPHAFVQFNPIVN